MRSARRDGAHLGEAGCAQRTRRILPVPFTLMSPSKRLWVPEKGVSFVEQTLPHQGGHHLVSRISYKRVGNGYQADCWRLSNLIGVLAGDTHYNVPLLGKHYAPSHSSPNKHIARTECLPKKGYNHSPILRHCGHPLFP
eukprot:213254-Prorocentrum_minimum.AAC.1